ncbi:MAG: hypothetical protein JNJ58_00950 [Chitinophagaceae bacterium]|nr:hypothetical protein [Chitinophagaceae bacterium]
MFQTSLAQKATTVNLNSMQSINKVAKSRSERTVKLLAEKVFIDSMQKKRISDFCFTLEQSYFIFFQHKNYTQASLLIRQQSKYKIDRNSFLKRILTDYQYSQFMQLQADAEKQDMQIRKVDLQTNDPMNKGIGEALGWDLLHEKLIMTEK